MRGIKIAVLVVAAMAAVDCLALVLPLRAVKVVMEGVGGMRVAKRQQTRSDDRSLRPAPILLYPGEGCINRLLPELTALQPVLHLLVGAVDGRIRSGEVPEKLGSVERQGWWPLYMHRATRMPASNKTLRLLLVACVCVRVRRVVCLWLYYGAVVQCG